MLHFAEIKLFSGSPLEDVEDIHTRGLEMRGSVIGFRNEKLTAGSILRWLVGVTNLYRNTHIGPFYVHQGLLRKYYLNKFLRYRSEEVEAGLDLGLGVVSLHGGGDHGDEPALG